MKACTRCGDRHTFAEHQKGKTLTCTEVKAFWSDISRRHKEIFDHYAKIRIRKDGQVICMICQETLDL